MSGGAQTQDPQAAAANAMASGAGGTAGADTQMAQMPTWQKGLMGAMTGSPAFGKNAPAIHAMMQQGLGMMQGPQPQMGAQRPPMQGAPPGFNAQGMAPPVPGQQQLMQPGPQGMQQPQQNPWLAGLNGR